MNRMLVTISLLFVWIMVYVITLLGQVTIDMISIHSFFLFLILMVNTLKSEVDVFLEEGL